MERKVYTFLIALCVSMGFYSCAENDGAFESPQQFDVAFIELFDTGANDWVGGISDYPDSLEGELNLQVKVVDLETAFSGDNNALLISAKNPHKDLFYYITRKFSGLQPNAQYLISFTYEFLIQAVDGEQDDFTSDLFLKAGGTADKPSTVTSYDYYGPGLNSVSLNYDKGEGFQNGSSSIYFIRHIQEKIIGGQSLLVQGETEGREIIVQTDDNGEFWVIFGIDSKNDRELAFAFNTILVFVKQI